jgi:hypothetical protein
MKSSPVMEAMVAGNSVQKNARLLVRYWGWGEPLTDDEGNVLLAALDAENKSLRGPTHLKALEWLREQGIE